MKIRAHLRELGNYTDLQRLLQFSEDVWNAFYKTEVQLKAAMHLKEAEDTMAKAWKAIEAEKSVRDLRTLESLLAHRQKIAQQVGDPPNKFLKAAKRVTDKPPTVHRLGQGSLPGLKAPFYKRYRRKITPEEMETGQKHGEAHLFAEVDAALESEEDSDDDEEESNDEQESTTPAPPPPTGGGGTSSDRSARASGSRGRTLDARREEEEEEEEQQEGEEEGEEGEEGEQEPPVAPPPSSRKRKEKEAASKKGSRKRRAPF
ncbi:unnamed protein product [Calypogeia fissa]